MNNTICFSSDCIECLIKRQMEAAKKCRNESERTEYMKQVLRIIAESDVSDVAPVIVAKLNDLHMEYMNEPYSFEQVKKTYNEMMLSKEVSIRQKIMASEEPVYAALQYSRMGNYIDFGALGNVTQEKLENFLVEVKDSVINRDEYERFCFEMAAGKRFVCLTDNCGEIVLDKLLIEVLMEIFPHLDVTVIVRGAPVLNDATLEDAEMVGLTGVTKVIGNGTKIAGTYLSAVSREVKQIVEEADVILSKGQGNFETMCGCGKNVYYAFLCKCAMFTKRFGLAQYEGVFVNEKRLKLD